MLIHMPQQKPVQTCFWMLVKSGKGKYGAHEGILSTDKNDLLFQRFRMNYNNDTEMFQKGSCTCQQKVFCPSIIREMFFNNNEKYCYDEKKMILVACTSFSANGLQCRWSKP
uniref:Thg1 C-terminal domain-containing protein n=1 Tax=Aegilops tauschii subsp. strangulata TaxID=200361 RepID=A0A452XQX8_AEGTS